MAFIRAIQCNMCNGARLNLLVEINCNGRRNSSSKIDSEIKIDVVRASLRKLGHSSDGDLAYRQRLPNEYTGPNGNAISLEIRPLKQSLSLQ